ncbi:MAG: molybdopterin oxidoreductase family protein [Myxococcales bacterium]|nr:molybdopterin oxidoreductase family protein [Myxococcales bacterium]
MKHYRTCCLCEAFCGLEIEHDGRRVLAIRGDEAHPLSRGHICPKGVALQDLHDDPDRLRQPQKRTALGFQPVSWEAAYDEIAERIAAIQNEHGTDSVALYFGNPSVHSFETLLALPALIAAVGSRNRYSASSADQWPHMFAAYMMFGNHLLFSVPDLERTDFMVIQGGNPAVSNGSLMTSGDPVGKLKAIRKRGGKLIVIDPRRTETAKLADEHHFLRPESDAWLLAAVVHTLFAEKRTNLGHLRGYVDGLEALEAAFAPFSPESVATAVGIEADTIRRLAREFAAAKRAVWYGRVGLCTQRFGGVAAWLLNLVNILSGHFDTPGGMMFPRPAIDLPRLAPFVGERGGYGRWRSRVRGVPEFAGELPVSVLGEEIETPGRGQIRALITVCGNPVLSIPNGGRLERALSQLDLFVAFDMYRNESTAHADFILPPGSPLERAHYGLGFELLSVRNFSQYSPPLFEPPSGARGDFESVLEVAERIARRKGGLKARAIAASAWGMRRAGAKRLLDGSLKLSRAVGGNREGLTVAKLEAVDHGIDRGPLESVLPQRLHWTKQRIRLHPPELLADLRRVRLAMEEATAADGSQLLLIGRRQLRGNNSWMHNSTRLMRGKDRCTLLMHPRDAEERGLDEGDAVVVRSRVGAVTVPIELSEDMMPGVVSLPHGFGHSRERAQLAVASRNPGVSANDLTDDLVFDTLSGNAAFNGVPVSVDAGR